MSLGLESIEFSTRLRHRGRYKPIQSAIAGPHVPQDQLILTIPSRPFVAEYFELLSVSSINSGATVYVPARRGVTTFVPLIEYPAVGGNAKKIAEVKIIGGVKNISKFIERAEVDNAAQHRLLVGDISTYPLVIPSVLSPSQNRQPRRFHSAPK